MKRTLLVIGGVAALSLAIFALRQGSLGNNSVPSVPKEIFCSDASRRAEVCAQNYDPVCATVAVQCFAAPCPPIQETFSNACEACRNGLAQSYTTGKCAK